MSKRATRKEAFDLASYSNMRCPLHGLMNMLSGTWTTYILWLLRQNEVMRFGELKKQMPGISAKVLTERLRMLEERGILSRYQENTIPPKVSYQFTQRGKELEAILDQFNEVASKW